MGLLIDSNVWIEYERGRFSIPDFLTKHGDQTVAIAAITASELLTGTHRGSFPILREKRRISVEATLQNVAIVSFDLNVARVHAALWAEIEAVGQTSVDPHDLIIAATAVYLNYALVSYDIKDFQAVPGLRVIHPNS